MKKIRFYAIQWDTEDGFDEDEDLPELPEEITLEVPKNMNVSENGCDALADKFGFCVFGFQWEPAK